MSGPLLSQPPLPAAGEERHHRRKTRPWRGGAPSSTTSTGSECLLSAGKGWRAREVGGPAGVHVSSALSSGVTTDGALTESLLCLDPCRSLQAKIKHVLGCFGASLAFFFGALSATRFLRSILTLSGGVFKMCVWEGGGRRREKGEVAHRSLQDHRKSW